MTPIEQQLKDMLVSASNGSDSIPVSEITKILNDSLGLNIDIKKPEIEEKMLITIDGNIKDSYYFMKKDNVSSSIEILFDGKKAGITTFEFKNKITIERIPE